MLKQLGTLLYVSLAFLFFKDEKFSWYKIIGVLLGFIGIIAMNANAAVILDENIFRIQYLLGFLLISFGIVLGGMKHGEPKVS